VNKLEKNAHVYALNLGVSWDSLGGGGKKQENWENWKNRI